MRQTLNLKIYQDLYNKIRSHFYKPGEQLPTESALAERYSTAFLPYARRSENWKASSLLYACRAKALLFPALYHGKICF